MGLNRRVDIGGIFLIGRNEVAVGSWGEVIGRL
jgi:hypothetical protein